MRKSKMPASGIRKSSSSNVPFPPSGAMPKSFSKKSTDISFPGDQLKSYKILFSLSQTEPLFDIRIGQGGQKLIFFGKTYRATGRTPEQQTQEVSLGRLGVWLDSQDSLELKCVCRVRVAPEFYAFHAFSAL
jgi:hypothetical protein